MIIQDIDECAGHPCLNNGVCHDGVNSYSCTCATGFAGTNCETSKNSLWLVEVCVVFLCLANDCLMNNHAKCFYMNNLLYYACIKHI